MLITDNSSSAVLSPLLRLPLELRRNIYDFALPFATTVPQRERKPGNSPVKELLFQIASISKQKHRFQKGKDVVWTRGCTALLAVSRQIHEETASMLYGDNTFIIDVKFDAIDFYFRWRTSNDLTPNRTYSFLEHFSQRNLLRIRHYVVNVEQVDEYTGMIKYNCGGQGLPAGMRAQVNQLAQLMASVEMLQMVHVNWLNSAVVVDKLFGRVAMESQKAKAEAQARTVLAPFNCLRGVRKVEMTGVSEQHVGDLRRRMTAPKSEPANSECN